tara:strand:- start:14983 stop:15201 length:219 start_codon:yes stop_codon:yes gene_type:complete
MFFAKVFSVKEKMAMAGSTTVKSTKDKSRSVFTVPTTNLKGKRPQFLTYTNGPLLRLGKSNLLIEGIILLRE